MKTALYKVLISFYLSTGRALPSYLAKRVQSDSGLLKHQAEEELLSKRLGEKLPETKEKHPRFIENQIWDKIDQESSVTLRMDPNRFRVNWLFGASAITALFVFIITIIQEPMTEKAPEFAENNPLTEIEPMIEEPQAPEMIQQFALQIESPLDTEIDFLYSDLRTAALFVASNFLPSDFQLEEVSDG